MIYNELLPRGTADFPIELYQLDHAHPRYEMTAHWHTEMEMVHVLKGTLDVKLNQRTYTAKEGDVLFINPETVHSAIPDNTLYECTVFSIPFLLTPNSGCRYFLEGILHSEYQLEEFLPKEDSALYRAAIGLFTDLANPSSGYKFKVTAALYRLFGEIIDAHGYRETGGAAAGAADKNVLKLKNVLSFIRENYSKPLSLADMAEAAEMSPKYFCYFFRKMTQKTPVEYLNDYRIEQASRKLVSSGYAVTEIAYSCGFNDLSYFIKTFKAAKGIPPTEYRKAID